MSSVIAVENLSKKYIIGHQKQERYTALRDVLANGAKRFTYKLTHPFAVPENDPAHEEFWAIKDVTFDIQQGDRVGIIGRNGAGKSTLLKIMSRITEPTSGKVSIKGRVASLLEVGTGFHPELTGRENIYLNGAILGMSKAEIRKKFDEIVAFAEVEKFLDTPVKHYSSGMYVRLAFAVAAHLEPEILILDEVLAVGDTQFQKKCMGKMEGAGKEGRTVLFVSHNMQAVQAMCNKSIWLHAGQVLRQGDTQDVVQEYLGSSQIFAGSSRENLDRIWDDPKLAPGNDKVTISRVHVVPDADNFNGLITVKVPLRIEFYYRLAVPIVSYIFAMHFRNISGELIFITGSTHENVSPGMYKSTGYIPGDFLNNGIYTVEIYFVKDVSNVLFNVKDLMIFEVHDSERESGWLGEFPGAVRPKLKWNFEPFATPE
jgi:lipopolysaccharide transport system ATP-binding protein